MRNRSQKRALVSIVLRTRDRSEMLCQAIRFVLNQTYRPIELIVIDNNSTDDTEQVVRSFGDFVKYYKHMGTYKDTFNIWRDKVKGEFISFLDDDDYITPDCIEKLANVLITRDEIDVVFCRKRFFSVRKDRCVLHETSGYVKSSQIRKMFVRQNIIHWNSFLFRKRCIPKIPILDEKIVGAFDWFIWVNLLIQRCNFYQIDNVLGYIQRTSRSLQYEIERISKGIVQVQSFYGKYLSCREKLSYGYFRYHGHQLISYGLLLLEKNDILKGRMIVLKGICYYSFTRYGRKKFIAAVLIFLLSFVSDPVKARKRIEILLKNYYFRNYFELDILRKNN